MTTSTANLSSESDTADETVSVPLVEPGGDHGGGSRGLHAFVRRSIALISAVAVFSLAALGVMTLGTLATADAPLVSHSRVADGDTEA